MGKPKPPEADPPPRIGRTRHAVVRDKHYGDFKLLFPVPSDDDPWGVFAPLKDTFYAEHIPVVNGLVFSNALHGLTKPLREQLGRPPRIDARRIPDADAWCALWQNGSCAMRGSNCRPGTGDLPQCYLSPRLDAEMAYLGSAVALAWDEGRYVIVIEGEGFVL